MDIVEYHKNRSCLDFNFIKHIFDADRRDAIRAAQERFPNSIIRMEGVMAGSVPSNHDGSIIYIPGI